MPKEKTTRKSKTKAVSEGKKKKGLSHPDNHVDARAKSLPDPNAPKRGLSAYMFFANEQRDNVRKDNPGISFGTMCPHFVPGPHANVLCRWCRQSPRREMEGT